jgi:hypothetical protein
MRCFRSSVKESRLDLFLLEIGRMIAETIMYIEEKR